MKYSKFSMSRLCGTLFLIHLTLFSSTTHAAKVDERPKPLAMFADALLVRPVMLATTVVGAGAFVLTLPLTLMGGNSEEVGREFVAVPFRATFLRCLGCTRQHVEEPEDYY